VEELAGYFLCKFPHYKNQPTRQNRKRERSQAFWLFLFSVPFLSVVLLFHLGFFLFLYLSFCLSQRRRLIPESVLDLVPKKEILFFFTSLPKNISDGGEKIIFPLLPLPNRRQGKLSA